MDRRQVRLHLPLAMKFQPIALGDLPKVQKEDLEGRLKEFFENPLIPWWSKVAAVVCPVPLHHEERKPTWCKYCGRKHSKREACANLYKIEDLTTEPKYARDEDPTKRRPIRPVALYSTKETDV